MLMRQILWFSEVDDLDVVNGALRILTASRRHFYCGHHCYSFFLPISIYVLSFTCYVKRILNQGSSWMTTYRGKRCYFSFPCVHTVCECASFHFGFNGGICGFLLFLLHIIIFFALRPLQTAMVMAGRSVNLITLDQADEIWLF